MIRPNRYGRLVLVFINFSKLILFVHLFTPPEPHKTIGLIGSAVVEAGDTQVITAIECLLSDLVNSTNDPEANRVFLLGQNLVSLLICAQVGRQCTRNLFLAYHRCCVCPLTSPVGKITQTYLV